MGVINILIGKAKFKVVNFSGDSFKLDLDCLYKNFEILTKASN